MDRFRPDENERVRLLDVLSSFKNEELTPLLNRIEAFEGRSESRITISGTHAASLRMSLAGTLGSALPGSQAICRRDGSPMIVISRPKPDGTEKMCYICLENGHELCEENGLRWSD